MKMSNMNKQQTDNSEYSIKYKLRKDLLKDGYTVLDCFHGNGVLYNNLKKEFNIKVFGIEKEKGKGTGLHGDNIKFLKNLDLSKYDIIDLDAYGIPFFQLEEIFNNKTLKKNSIVIYTMIQTMQGSVHKKMLDYYGINNKMYNKCRTLFKNHGHKAFLNYLNINGVKEVSEYFVKKKSSLKHYGFFIIKGGIPE
jgi:hypothetical protein